MATTTVNADIGKIDTSGNVTIIKPTTTGSNVSLTGTYSNVQTLVNNLGSAAYKAAGSASGVATLGTDGKVPSSQLPSYVDDVVEYDTKDSFPSTGESGKIYVALDTNKMYRWSGTVYTEVSASLALGETSSTAYPGDKGKAVTDNLSSHTSNKSNPHGVTAAQVGLGNVNNTSDADKPISTAVQAALDKKADITGETTVESIAATTSLSIPVDTTSTADGAIWIET